MEKEAAPQELEMLRAENKDLRRQLKEAQTRVHNFGREMFLADLVGSNSMTDEEFKKNCQEFDFPIRTDRFVMIGVIINSDPISMTDDDGPANQEDLRYTRFLIRNVMEDLIRPKNSCEAMVVRGKMAFLVNLSDPAENGQSLVPLCEKAAQLFETHYETSLMFSISRTVVGHQNIPKTMEDLQAIDRYRRLAEDDSKVLRYDDFDSSWLPSSRKDHFQMEHRLGTYLQNGDYESARALVHEMLGAEFNHSRPSLEIYTIRAYAIISDILHVFESMEGELPHAFVARLQAVPRILAAGSVAEVTREFDAIFDEIAEEKGSHEREPEWIDRAIDYMKSSYADPNLNVAKVADEVGINPVYLSRMLKEYRNIRPLEYIHQLRIRQAKELLGAGVSVKDTMHLVGYSSSLTMNRAFRKMENTTPGAFYRPSVQSRSS